MKLRRVFLAWTGVVALTLAGCAQSLRPMADAAPEGPQEYWSGKLALHIDSQPRPGAYFANFELSGNAVRGELLLTSPLGTTLAQLDWQPGKARLRQSGDERTYGDLNALAAEATGTELPVAALFDWLNGRAVSAQGWQADLHRLDDGKLSAHRSQPTPVADLQLIFER